MPTKSQEPSKKPSKKKLTEDEKRELKIAKQQSLLRDYFGRELKFSNISHKRNEKTHFKLVESFKAKDILTKLTSDTQHANHLMNKIENAAESIKIHRDHAAEQHMRIQTFQSKLIEDITGEMWVYVCHTVLYYMIFKNL